MVGGVLPEPKFICYTRSDAGVFLAKKKKKRKEEEVQNRQKVEHA